MLMASSKRIVGEMNSQARPLSLMPRTLRANGSGVARATFSAVRLSMVSPASVTWVVSVMNLSELRPVPRVARDASVQLGRSRLHLAVVLEHLRPVLDQAVKRILGRTLAGNDIVVEALL